MVTSTAEVKPERPDRPDLDALLAYWQPVLGLTSWAVCVIYARQSDPILYDDHMFYSGRCEMVRQRQQADITILEPGDQTSRRGADVEQTLVHELLHLHFDAVSPEKGTEQHIQFEIAINALALGFVRVKRAR